MTYVALVGGQRFVGEVMEIGLLSDEEFMQLAQGSNESGLAITMRYQPGHQLRIVHNRKIVYKIPRSKLDGWKIPGG